MMKGMKLCSGTKWQNFQNVPIKAIATVIIISDDYSQVHKSSNCDKVNRLETRKDDKPQGSWCQIRKNKLD